MSKHAKDMAVKLFKNYGSAFNTYEVGASRLAPFSDQIKVLQSELEDEKIHSHLQERIEGLEKELEEVRRKSMNKITGLALAAGLASIIVLYFTISFSLTDHLHHQFAGLELTGSPVIWIFSYFIIFAVINGLAIATANKGPCTREPGIDEEAETKEDDEGDTQELALDVPWAEHVE